MADTGKRLAKLSPAQREMLFRKLKESGKNIQRERIGKRPNRDDYPLSIQQQQLWFLHQLDPNSAFYNMPAAVRLEGEIDICALEYALDKIVQRHEIMRSSFDTVEGKPVQRILPELKIKIETYDCSAFSGKLLETKVKDLFALEINKSFDLKVPPLLRSSVIHISETVHILVINLHHIIADGWSVGIIIKEFSFYYKSYKTQDNSELPPLTIQYADYAWWELEWLNGPQKEKQLDYWKKQLDNCYPYLDFPYDFLRPAIQTFNGSSIDFEISTNLTNALKKFCNTSGTTLYMVLLTALSSLLYRYTNQEDICIGTAMANRDRPEIADLVGYFMNTLVIRSMFSKGQSFSEQLKQIKGAVLDCFSNQDLPFEKIVEELKPQRDPSHSPFFQVLFILQNAPKPKIELPNVSLSLIQLQIESAKYDITLTIEESENKLLGRLGYNTSLLKKESIENFKNHYLYFLEQIVKDPQTVIEHIRLLSETDKKTVLHKWNRTDCEFNLQTTIHALFEQKAETYSQKIALIHNGTAISFSELNHKSNQLAAFLQSQGIVLETPVGIYMNRSLDMMIALLAILKAGGTYVPLTPAQPVKRTRYIVDDANISLIISEKSLAKDIQDINVKHILLDKQWEQISSYPEKYITRYPHKDNLAYIIYTSGTTGQPKGIGIRHSSILNLFYSLNDKIYRRHNTIQLNISLNGPLTFDTSVKQWIQLINGHTLHIIPEEIRRDGSALVRYIREHSIHVFDCTPSQLNLLIESGLFNENEHQPDIVLIGGEAIDIRLWETLNTNKTTIFYNLYGPTECTVDASIFTIGKSTKGCYPKPRIGKGLNNTKLYILDSQLQPVPPGISGELCIAGAGLARGYIRQPKLTAEKFIPNPFSTEKGARLYRSGDRARFLPDGNIEFLGRIDRQVKLRGFRIELSEVESILTKFPEIKDSVVQVQQHKLCAFISSFDKAKINLTKLRTYLKRFLPDYMLPSLFIPLDKIPLTVNGKIDYRALVIPAEIENQQPSYQAPRNELETILCQFWQKALNINKIGVYDSFFELGGDSLKAAYFINQLQQQLNKNINVSVLFERQHIAALSEYLIQNFPDSIIPFIQSILPESEIDEDFKLLLSNSSLEVSTDNSAYIALKKVERNTNLELSFAQQRLWFLDQLEPGKANYNIPASIRMRGQVEMAGLIRAIHQLAERHESLRTIFVSKDGKASQVLANDLAIPIEKIHLHETPASERMKKAMQIIRAEARTPFDLSKGPLMRVKLIELVEDDHILMMNMHHIISDGWSVGIIIRDLSEMYKANIEKRQPELPDLSVQYVDYAIWQRTLLPDTRLRLGLQFWEEQFKDAPSLIELPIDRPRPAVQTFNGQRLFFELSERISTNLKKLANELEATPFMVLLAGFQILLHRYAGQETILIGTPVANRNRREIENIVGFFVNTLVIRGDFSTAPDFYSFLRQIKQRTGDAFAHQELPFEKIVDSLKIERSLSHNPLFQVMFAYQPPLMDRMRMAGIECEPLELDAGFTKFDLTVSMAERDNRFSGEWEFNTDLWDRSTIERMITHFIHLLSEITENPARKISRYALMDEPEIKHILEDFNAVPPIDYPEKALLHELFEQQVERTPDNAALVYKGQTLSYRELNNRANQLSNFLIKKGVGPEQFVGISVERNFDLVVAIYGILKTGAAYVPLDPSYPIERLSYMAKETDLTYILTQHQYVDTLEPIPGKKIVLDSNWQEISEESTANPGLSLNNQNLCYVIYTSGSSGWPKGVQVQHNTVIILIKDYIQKFKLNASKRLVQYFSYSFDGSVGDVFMTLFTGASLYLVDKDEMMPDSGLIALIRDNHITNAVLPPALLSVLPADEFPDLTMLASGGDVCTPELTHKWASPRRKYYNAYGPTETTVCATWYLTNNLAASATNVPIGKPIPHYRIYILDKHFKPLPIGVPGEMFIGGKAITRGYLKKPDLTAEKFLPDPFSKEAGVRMYATGDLCRYLPDGNIEFLGRIDQQVKIRGFRIEIGEVEAALLDHEAVKETVVLAKGQSGSKQLVAYVVLSKDQELTINDMRNFLQKRLPEYMIPAYFVFLDSMPVSATGKIDKKQLPDPAFSREALQSEYIAPHNEKEEILVNIWKELLNLPQAGIKDNFFELGGDSITSIQMIARAKQKGLQITPKDIFANPTIEGLAEIAGQTSSAHTEQGLVLGDVPLTPIQHAFFERDIAERGYWNQSIVLETEAFIPRDTLEKVTLKLLEHHDALRMRYRQSDEGWRQYFAEPDDVAPVVYLQGCENDPLKFEAEVERLQSSLNLENSPLIRVGYFDMGAQPDRILIAIHHLVIDGVSWRILLEDFYSIYSQLHMQRAPLLPAKTTSFKYWAEKLLDYAQSDALLQELDFWRHFIDGDIPVIPVDHPEAPNREAEAAFVEKKLEKEFTKSLLQNVASAVNIKPGVILLAALANAFKSLTGAKTFYVDLEGHGREDIIERVDLSRTVGWFTTLYPFYLNVNDIDDPGEQIRLVDEKIRSIPNNGIGFGLLKYLSHDENVRRAIARIPAPQVSFNYLGRFEQAESGIGNFRVLPSMNAHERSPLAKREYLIDISASIRNDILHVRCAFSGEKLDQKRMEILLEEYIQELKRMIQFASEIEAKRDIELIDAVTDEEIDDILNELEI